MDINSHNAGMCLPYLRSQTLSTGVLWSWVCRRVLHTTVTNESLVRPLVKFLLHVRSRSCFKFSFEWLLYINPSYYGYSGMLRVVLPSIKTGCDYQSSIECYPDTGEYWLEDFGMEDVQPYLSLLVSFLACFYPSVSRQQNAFELIDSTNYDSRRLSSGLGRHRNWLLRSHFW